MDESQARQFCPPPRFRQICSLIGDYRVDIDINNIIYFLFIHFEKKEFDHRGMAVVKGEEVAMAVDALKEEVLLPHPRIQLTIDYSPP